MDKTEWPTEDRISELRAEGLVPYSSYATAAASAIAILLALFILKNSLRKIGSAYLELLSDGQQRLDGARLVELAGDLPLLFLLPCICVVAGAFITGFLQTKFMVHSSAMRFQFNRLSPFSRSGEGGWLSAIVRGLRSLVFAFVAILFGVIIFWLITHFLLSMFNGDVSYLLASIMELLPVVIPAVALFLFVSGVLFWLVSRFVFMLSHRMSREEIEQESA